VPYESVFMDKSCVTMHNVLVNQSWETWPNGRTTPAGSNGTLQDNSCISIKHGAEQRGESERWSAPLHGYFRKLTYPYRILPDTRIRIGYLRIPIMYVEADFLFFLKETKSLLQSKVEKRLRECWSCEVFMQTTSRYSYIVVFLVKNQ
jgi:hypothetical protein